MLNIYRPIYGYINIIIYLTKLIITEGSVKLRCQGDGDGCHDKFVG